MAVPSAVSNRIQRETAELVAQGIDPNAPPAALPASTPTAAPVPPSALAPAPIDDASALRAENERLKHELATQGGRVSATASEVSDLKARLELINSNRSFLESSVTEQSARMQQLEQELAEAKANGTRAQAYEAASALDESGPTKEQIEQFGVDSQQFVERIVRQQMAAVIKPLVAQMTEMGKVLGRVKDIDAKLPQLEKSAQVADINVARQREEQFLRTEVLPHFPDFETVRNTPEWKAYLSSQTGRGYPIGALLKTYREQNDANGIRTVLGAFYDKRMKPTLDSLAVPAKTTADAPPAPAAPKMKASEYKVNLKAFTSKRMTKQEWDAYRTRWEEALNAGNVEMDTELR